MMATAVRVLGLLLLVGLGAGSTGDVGEVCVPLNQCQTVMDTIAVIRTDSVPDGVDAQQLIRGLRRRVCLPGEAR